MLEKELERRDLKEKGTVHVKIFKDDIFFKSIVFCYPNEVFSPLFFRFMGSACADTTLQVSTASAVLLCTMTGPGSQLTD